MALEFSPHVYEKGANILVGEHGQDDFTFASRKEVLNEGGSSLVFEQGTGLGCQGEPAGQEIDLFDDGDVSEYAVYTDTTGTSFNPTFETRSGTVQSGSHAGYLEPNASGDSKSGLPYYPGICDSWEYYLNYQQGSKGNYPNMDFFWAVQDAEDATRYFPENAYKVRIRATAGKMQISKQVNGTRTGFGEVDIPLGSTQANEWLRVVIDWDHLGNFLVTVYDSNGNELAQADGQDTTFTGGGITILISTPQGDDATYYIDSIQTV